MRRHHRLAAIAVPLALSLTLAGWSSDRPLQPSHGQPTSRGVQVTTVVQPAPSARTAVSDAWAADIALIEAEGGRTQTELDSLVWQIGFAEAMTEIQETFRRLASSGDSGGPWHAGNSAVGIHSGYVTHLLLARDVWTPIRPNLSALGLTLKIS